MKIKSTTAIRMTSFILVGLMLNIITKIHAQENPNRQGPGIVSPDISADNSVTFRLFSKNANSVSLNGSWMGMGETKEMTKNEEGVWGETAGGHTWANWRIYLSDFAPALFK